MRRASEKREGNDPDPCHELAGNYTPGLLLPDGRSTPQVPVVPQRSSAMPSGAGSLAAGRGRRCLSETFVP